MNTITKRFYGEGGALIDPASVVLEDFSGVFGVKRLDTDGVVVPAGTEMTRESTGVYTHSFIDPAPNLTYEYWVKFVVSGNTFYSGANLTSALVTAGYTLEELIDALGNMLNELNQAGDQPFEYSPPMGVRLLNWAQRRLVTLLPMSFFDALHETRTGIALDAEGAFALSSITPEIWEKTKGIMGVRHTGGKFANRISFEEYRKFKDRRRVFTCEDPVSYLRGGNVYVEPYSAGDTAALYWMREPEKMAIDPYGDHGDDTQCELPPGAQDIMLDLAAWRGYVIGGNPKRGEDFLGAASAGIAAVTGRETPTESITQGIDRRYGEYGEEGFVTFLQQYVP